MPPADPHGPGEPGVRLSILDASPVKSGATAVDAFAETSALARSADQLGFNRYWVTELHGSRLNAGSTPEVTMAHIASITERIRVGSGATLLNHRSPYAVAETFAQLNAMFPGRIDLGLGRATAGSLVDLALQQDRSRPRTPGDHEQQVTEVLAWLAHDFPADHPFAVVPLSEGVEGSPQPWILGSSPSSGALAGRLGLSYAFAGFLAPRAAPAAIAAYRSAFDANGSPQARDAPYVLLAINAACAVSDEEAAAIGASAELVYRSAAGGQRLESVPSSSDATWALGGTPQPTEYRPGRWPSTLSGSPDRLRDVIQHMADEVGADEIAVQDMIAEPTARQLSYELLADAFSLKALPAADPHATHG